jgi:hypothetical protein
MEDRMPKISAEDFVICPGCGDPVRKTKLKEADSGLFDDDEGVECPLCGHTASADAFKPVKGGK